MHPIPPFAARRAWTMTLLVVVLMVVVAVLVAAAAAAVAGLGVMSEAVCQP